MEEVYAFLTISNKSESFFKDKGSKFYGYAYPLINEDDIRLSLDEVKLIHPKARHVCYAYRFGLHNEQEKAADAGEPGGSAGLPILNQIKSTNLSNTLVIVVRYFGGTKLGIPGLISAYKLATKEVLDSNKIIEKEVTSSFTLNTNYENANLVFTLINGLNGQIISQDYSAAIVVFEVEIPLKVKKEFLLKVEDNYLIDMKIDNS